MNKIIIFFVFASLLVSCNSKEKEQRAEAEKFQQYKQELANYVADQLKSVESELSKIELIMGDENGKHEELVAGSNDIESIRKNVPLVQKLVKRDLAHFDQFEKQEVRTVSPPDGVLFAGYHKDKTSTNMSMWESGTSYYVNGIEKIFGWKKRASIILEKISSDYSVDAERKDFDSQISTLKSARYLVITEREYTLYADIDVQNKTFMPGYMKTNVRVYDLQKLSLISTFSVYVTNRDSILFEVGKYFDEKSSAGVKALEELHEATKSEINARLREFCL